MPILLTNAIESAKNAIVAEKFDWTAEALRIADRLLDDADRRLAKLEGHRPAAFQWWPGGSQGALLPAFKDGDHILSAELCTMDANEKGTETVTEWHFFVLLAVVDGERIQLWDGDCEEDWEDIVWFASLDNVELPVPKVEVQS